MNLRVLIKNKKAHIVSEEIITWILYISIAVAAGVTIKMIISRFAG